MLAKAINAFNTIAQLEIDEIHEDLRVIREYLSDQSIRHSNEMNGCAHLNREMDVVARLKATIASANNPSPTE